MTDWDHLIGKRATFRVKVVTIGAKRIMLCPVEISFDQGESFYPFRDHMWVKRLGPFKRQMEVKEGQELLIEAKVSKYNKALATIYQQGKVRTIFQQDYELRSARYV